MGLNMKGHNMKFAIPTCAVAALLAAAPVLAADEPAAEAADWTVTTNIGLTNAYFFRGLNFSDQRPAVQGGADVAHSSGFYAGIWASNTDPDSFLGGPNVEIDLYGGFAKAIGPVTADVGVLQFIYPGANIANTTELYAAGTWEWLNVKYSHTMTEYFGFAGTEGSGYVEGNVNYEFLPSWVLNLHAGHQRVADLSAASYSDFKFGVTKNLASGWQVSLAGIAVDANDKSFLVKAAPIPGNPNVFESVMDLHYQVMVKRTF